MRLYPCSNLGRRRTTFFLEHEFNLVKGETLYIFTTASLVLLPTPPSSFIRAVRVDDEVLVILEVTADAKALIVLAVGRNLGTDVVDEITYDRVCLLV